MKIAIMGAGRAAPGLLGGAGAGRTDTLRPSGKGSTLDAL